MLGSASDSAAGWGGGGAKKHEIYVAAFGGHLFYDLFVRGGGRGPLGTPPPWIRYWGYTPETRGSPPPDQRQAPPGAHTPLPGADTTPREHTPLPPQHRSACWEIRATSGCYASYWNAILFALLLQAKLLVVGCDSFSSSRRRRNFLCGKF